MAGGTLIDSLYYEVELRTQGVEAGAARTQAVLKEIDAAADRTQRNISKIGESTSDRSARNTAIAELNEQFKAGAITEAAYIEKSAELGVKLKTLSPAAQAAASAFVAEGAAASGAAVATEAASVATKGLLAILGPFVVAMFGVEAISKLVRLAWDALTASSRKLKEETEQAIQRLEQLQRLAPSAQLSGDIAKTQAELAARRAALATLKAAEDFSNPAGDPSVLPGTAESRAKEIKRLADLVKTGEAELSALNQKSAAEADRGFTQNLASLIRGNKATAEQISNARTLIAAWTADLDKLGKSDVGGRAALLAQIDTLQGAFDSLQKAGERTVAKAESVRDRVDKVRAQGASLLAAQTPQTADNLEQQVAAFTRAAEAANREAERFNATTKGSKIALIDVASAVKAIEDAAARKNIDQLKQDLLDLTAQSTVTAVDDLTNGLDALIKKLTLEGATPAMIDQVRALQQPLIDATARSEDLAKSIEKIQGDLAAGFNLKQDLAGIQPLIDRAIAARNAAPAGSKAQALAQSDLDKLLAIEVELREKIRKIQLETAGHTTTIREKTISLAGDIATAANAAFGLSAAFLGVDSNITKALGSVGQLAGGIQSALKASSLIESLSGISQAIGGALALGSALFGKSPEEEARIQRTKENTEALRELSRRMGDLAASITGTDVGRVTGFVNDPRIAKASDELQRLLEVNRRAIGGIGGDFFLNANRNIDKAIRDALASADLTAHEFADIAKQLGIVVDEAHLTADDIALVKKRLEEAKLGEFAHTFEGQMAKLNDEINLFDIKDPIAQIKAFRKALDSISGKDGGPGGGILADIIDKFDLSNPEGISAAIAALQKLFTDITSGAINSKQFGGLSAQDILDSILKLKDILAGTATGAAAGTGGFNRVTSITEVTGSRIGAMLSTANIFAEMTARNTAGILAAIGGTPTQLISPPAISRPNFQPVNASTSVSITLNVEVSGIAGDAEATGTKIGRAAIQEISRGLGNDLAWRNRAVGNVVRT